MLGPDGAAGLAVLADLQQKHGPLPTTPRARSGGGEGDRGRHYLFAWPSEGSVCNRQDHRGLPVDVRGKGGLFVAPPSVHLSGHSYEWEVPPEAAPLAEAPAWLLEWVRTGKSGSKRKKGGERTN